ncbi:hypothetical protein BDR04DRAFT_575235 [Suillus decipiens]|nr:hypothetical protein BDR04DRAFT_575235 [Suillus decipiens]
MCFPHTSIIYMQTLLQTSKHERSRRTGLLNVRGPIFSSSAPYRCSLQSDATRRPVRRKPVIIPAISPIPRPLPTRGPDAYLRFLRRLLSSSSRTDGDHIDEPHNSLDFPATSPLCFPHIKPDGNPRSTPALPTTQSSVVNTSVTLKSSLHRLTTWWPFQTHHASLTIVDVPLAPGKLTMFSLLLPPIPAHIQALISSTPGSMEVVGSVSAFN